MNKIQKELYNARFPNIFIRFCHWIGWGFPISETEIRGDAFQPVYHCMFCDRDLAQDSNGDYFHLTPTTTK